MKKTLIITLEYPPTIGGIGTYTHQFVKALPSDKVVVLTLPHKEAEVFDAAQSFKTLRRVFYFPKLIWPRWLLLYFTVRKIVKSEGIEMIHVHHMIPTGYVAVLIKKLHKVPFLVFSHGTDFVFATKSKWKQRWTEMVLSHADQVIANSNSLHRRFVAKLPVAEGKVTILYPCPDKELLEPVPVPETSALKTSLALEGKKVLLTVTRLADGKGVPQMVALLAEIVKSQPNVVWILIGDGPKKELVMKLIQKYRLQNVVRFLGAISHNELRPYYGVADVFVSLTHPDQGKEEGLGLVFLEAAAAGLPIVAGKSGGVEEAVLHTQTGLVVNTYNKEEVFGAITKLLRDTTFAERLGAAAKLRIQTEFNWEHQLQRIRKWM